jgi:hypothetical protein
MICMANPPSPSHQVTPSPSHSNLPVLTAPASSYNATNSTNPTNAINVYPACPVGPNDRTGVKFFVEDELAQ